MRFPELGACHGDLPAILGRDGCAFLPAAVDPRMLTPLADEIAATLAAWGITERRGDVLVRRTAPADAYDRAALHRGPVFGELVRALERGAGPWQDLGDRVLGGRAHLKRAATLFVSLPDDPATRLPPHQDGFRATFDGHPHYRVWLPLFPVPHGDGGLGVLPGSHAAGYLPEVTLTEPLRTTAMRPGDALVFESRCVHASLPPVSDSVRVAVAIGTTADRPGLVETFHPGEMAERTRLLRAAAGDASDDVVRDALVDLNLAGLHATSENVAAALAGRLGRWRHHTP